MTDTTPTPFYDSSKTTITAQELANIFADVSSDGELPLSVVHEHLKTKVMNDPEKTYNYRHYDSSEATYYKGQTYNIPTFSVINFYKKDIKIIDTAFAMIRFAIDKKFEVEYLSEALEVLDKVAANFSDIVILGMAYNNVPKTKGGAGGQANTGKNNGDNELETVINPLREGVFGGKAGRVEFLNNLFHEISHGYHRSHDSISFGLNSNIEELSSEITIKSIEDEPTYRAGILFVTVINRIRNAIHDLSNNGNGEFRFQGKDYNTDVLSYSEEEIKKVLYGNNNITGLISVAWERYENERTIILNTVLNGIMKTGSRKTPNELNNIEILNRLEMQGFIKLKDEPDGWQEEGKEKWGGNIDHYEYKGRRIYDHNKDKIVEKGIYGKLDTIIFSGLGTVDRSWQSHAKLIARGVVEGITTIDGGRIGLALGSILGNRLTDNVFDQIGASAALSTALRAFGEFIDTEIFDGTASASILSNGLDSVADTFLSQVQNNGVGALSSYLTGEFFKAVDIDGVIGEFGETVAGAYLKAVVNNLPSLLDGSKTFSQVFNGVTDAQGQLIQPGAINLPSLAGSFLGSRLANEIKTFSSVGGQIGSAAGGIYGGFAATAALGSLGITAGLGATASGGTSAALAAAQFAAANPFAAVAIVAAVVAFNTLLGGLVGSLFGGTPRSGADVVWDKEAGQFTIANIYSRKGGSKEAAANLAGAVASNFDTVVAASGAEIMDPFAVQTGNYGMRKKAYVYRPIATRDKEAITARFTGNNAPGELINHGTYIGLNDLAGQLAGGNVFVKRAVVASLANAGGNPNSNSAGASGNFNMETLLGDIVVANDYSKYLQASAVINALIAEAPETGFAAGWLITLSRAEELNLNRRSYTDWIGGYDVFLDEAIDGRIGGESLIATQIEMGVDVAAGLRYWTVYDTNELFLDFIEDTIEAGAHSHILGTSADDTIRLSNTQLLATSGATNAGLTIDGVAHDGSALDIDVAATIDAGAGDDIVHASGRGDNVFGGEGDDTLYGGRLDDWLLGGEGNDRLDAGAQNGGLGGDGNYLNGGAGDDQLFGREGSDWLEGGDGVDILRAGDGGDILSGGAGGGDELYGGGGDDSYLFRRGDGADVADDLDARAPVAPRFTNPGNFPGVDPGDPVAARFAAIASGALKRDWLGTSAAVSRGQVAGGEDAVAFGYGIGIGDIRLTRSEDGDDLIVEIMEIGEDGLERPSGDRLTVRDWFSDPFKRVEWLKFVDGTEIRIGDLTSFVVGAGGADVLIGTNGNDFVYGGAGDDELRLLAGDDVGNGGTGNDLVVGDDGRDLLIGGLGNDRLIGGRGKDAITGDAGADDIYAGDDDDIISGGRGDGDLLVGGAGNDMFKYARGDGHDTVFDDYADYWQVVWTSAGGWNVADGFIRDPVTTEVTGPGGEYIFKNVGTRTEPRLEWIGRFDFDAATGELKRFAPPADARTVTRDAGVDTIEFGLDIAIRDIILHNPAGTDDLVLLIGDENSGSPEVSDTITLKDWYVAPGGIEKLAFYSTGILDIDPSNTRLVAGTDGDDGTLATPLAGSAINDWITGAGGDDVIAGGDGDDILAGNGGFDMLRGEAGQDVLYGGSGNDILDGGMGRDILVGGTGQDAASYASSAAGVKVHLSAPQANTGDALGDEFDSIEDLTGSAGADELGGDEGENELTGGRGNDMLAGNTGDDSYVWNIGDGSDIVAEGAFIIEEAVTPEGILADGYRVSMWQATGAVDPVTGWRYWRLQVEGPEGELVYDSASYLYPARAFPSMPLPTAYIQSGWLDGYSRTSGQQITRQTYDASVDGGYDVLEFGKGITLNDLSFAWEASDLVIRYLGQSTSKITLRDQASANTAVEEVLLSDGFGFSLASIVPATNGALTSGSAGDDLVLGRHGIFADRLAGGAGDDVLVGYAGNDRLSGGAGNDVMAGGLGADTIDGGADDGGAGDTVRYTGSATGVTVDLSLSGAQGGDAGSDAFGDTLTDIESVVGSAFADTISGDGGDNRLFGLAGRDVLSGKDGDDVLTGDDGNDILLGGDGEDSLSGGEGADSLYGGRHNDVLDGGAGRDSLYGGSGDDNLIGGDGNDWLRGGAGSDTLIGGSGYDHLIGDMGDDMLAGGAGADQLRGGAGADTYHFDRHSGADTIIDSSRGNLLTFDSSVAFDELWLTRSGSDLHIAVIGTETTVKVRDFFAPGGQDRIHAIQTTGHAIFVDHPGTLALVDAMTAASVTPTTPPEAMPDEIADLLAAYWHEGGKAAPIPPDTPRDVRLAEDGVVTLDSDYGVIDHDRNIVSYAILPGGEPRLGAITNLDPATGALTYTPFADANGEDGFTLIATDADGHAVELPVRVTIDAVNDAPRALVVDGGGGLTVAEGAPGSTTAEGTLVGIFSALDVEGEEVRFSLADDAGGRFSLLPNGELRVLGPTLLDREAAASHTIQVVATDPHGAAARSRFTVAVGNVNEAPDAPIIATASGLVAEHVAGTNSANAGTTVATFTLADPDAGATLALRLVADPSGNPDGWFRVVGNRIEFAGEPDFETLAGRGLTITDSDGDGFGEVSLTGRVEAFDGELASGRATSFTVRIEDVNQRQTAIALVGKAGSITERDRVAAGTARPAVVLGTVSVTDPDLPGQPAGRQSFAVFENGSNTPSTRFAVDNANQLVLLANSSLDYETDGASITLTVQATDGSSAPLSFEQEFSFEILNANDIVDGTSAVDTLTGQQNRDVLNGFGGNDIMSGLAGNDLLYGGDGDDSLYGGADRDLLIGDAGADSLYGGEGNDYLTGRHGDDYLDGGPGADKLVGHLGNEGVREGGSDPLRGFTAAGLVGGAGDDTISGNGGDDYLDGGAGADRLSGGRGFDGVTYAGSNAGVTIDLARGTGSGGDAQGDTLSGIELVEGSAHSDTLTGSGRVDVLSGGAGDDTLHGGAGNDRLLGGAGNDMLFAQSGDDYLDGGAGDDTLIGGAGSDTYYFERGQGNDRIRNFDASGTDFDQLTFDGSVLYTDIWFERVGDDLHLTLLGTSGTEGSVTVERWFANPERMLPENYFRIDLVSDGTVRAALPVNVDALVDLMASIPEGGRPTTQAEMATLRGSNTSFRNGMEDFWGRLSPPKISNAGLIGGIEALDNGVTQISFSVRAWFEDEQDIGVDIPAGNIDLSLYSSGGQTLSDYVTDVNYGTPDASGNRTVTLTLAPNASTHLLPGGTLPLQLQAQIRGTTRTTLDAGGIALSIAPTADNGVFTQLASAGGNAGSAAAIALAASTPDTDGSESVDVLVRGLPAGYSLVDSSGAAVGQYESASDWWRLTSSQLNDLGMLAPAGRYENALLSFAVQTRDGSSVRTSAWTSLTVVVNGKPTAISLSGSVTENAATGTLVGLLSASDPDTAEGAPAPARFELLNSVGGRYVLDPANSARLLVNNGGGNIDYEASNRDAANTITVRAFDADGGYVDRQIVVPVTNVNEQNSLPASYSWNVNENAAAGTLVGTVAASDPDSASGAFGRQRYYFLNGGSASSVSFDGRYRVNAVSGRITTRTALDFEAGNPSAAYTVIARDNKGTSGYKQTQSQVTIGINNLNEQNSLPSSYSWNVNENVATGPLVGTVAASDPDSASVALGRQRYYFLNGGSASSVSSDGRYGIDAISGRITTRAALDFEAGNPSAAYTVIARDNEGTSGYKQTQSQVTIGINNLNEQNSLPSSYSWNVNENVATGTLVGTVEASDPDSASRAFGRQRYYFLNGGSASSVSFDGRYRVNAVSGRITTRTALNFEAGNPSAAYTVIARDNEGKSGYNQSQRQVTISIGDVDELHSLVAASGSIVENRPMSPQTVPAGFDLNVSMLRDPENRGMTWSFADGSTESGVWVITADGKLTLKAGVADYEALTTRHEERTVFLGGNLGPIIIDVPVRDHSLATQTLSVKAIDALGRSVSGTFTATITDENEGPGLGSATTFYVEDDQKEGYFGRIRGIDPETGDPASSYRIISVAKQEVALSRGSSRDVDNTGDPLVSIASSGTYAGRLYFSVPGDGEWEGGIKYHPTLGGRWYFQLNYVMQIGLTDAFGVENVEEVTVIFKKHNTSAVLPIVLDLDGDGLELVDYDSSAVYFDMDLDGIADRTGWVGADDALLALDRNGNGIIDDSSEISFADDLENALTDLEGLRAFDTNANGLLDAGDERFADFRVWQDVDQNGVSDDGELRTLAEAGIVQLNLTLNQTGEEPADDRNVIFATTEYLKTNGNLGTVGDISFAYEPSLPDAAGEIGLPDDVELVWVAPSGIEEEQAQAGQGGSSAEQAGNGETPAENDRYGLAAPIVLDFDGDGEGLVSLAESTTSFDQDGDGTPERTGWIEAGDALLALDRNGNGTIDDIAEISFLADKQGARTDLEGLAAFDSNSDGLLDASDERFVDFRLWFDRDSDGVTDAGELLSLAEGGISSIALVGTPTGETATPGSNIVYNRAEFTRDGGETGTVLDAGFAYLTNHSIHTTSLTGQDTPDTGFAALSSRFSRKSNKYRVQSLEGELAIGFKPSGKPVQSSARQGLLPEAAKSADLAAAGERAAATVGPHDASWAHMLALLTQDMAAFGQNGGRVDELRDHREPFFLADIYS